jgi:hypothetical protein
MGEGGVGLSSFEEERENHWVGRFPRVAPEAFGATAAGLFSFAPLEHQSGFAQIPESLSGKWVARATRPCRSATRRPEERGGSLQKTHLHCLGARFPFRPASRRAVQASGPFYPKANFRTGSEIRVWTLRLSNSLKRVLEIHESAA